MTKHPCVLSEETVWGIFQQCLSERPADLTTDEKALQATVELRMKIAERIIQESISLTDEFVESNAEKLAEQREPLSEAEIITTALDGFMISTEYSNDDPNKRMPVSDTKTLIKFARAIEARCGVGVISEEQDETPERLREIFGGSCNE